MPPQDTPTLTPKDGAHFQDYTYVVPCVSVKFDCYVEKSSQGDDIYSLFHLALFPYKIGQIPSLAQAVDNSFMLNYMLGSFCFIFSRCFRYIPRTIVLPYPKTLRVMRLRRS